MFAPTLGNKSLFVICDIPFEQAVLSKYLRVVNVVSQNAHLIPSTAT